MAEEWPRPNNRWPKRTLGVIAIASMLGACQKLPHLKIFSSAKSAKTSKNAKLNSAAADAGKLPDPPWHFHAVLGTGDDSSPAFDNARHAIAKILVADGVRVSDIAQLSLAARESEAHEGAVVPTSSPNLAAAFQKMTVKKGDACFIHLTSHGSPWGFYMKGRGNLTPTALDKMLTVSCGEAPTFVFVSACYSGVFTGNAMARPNRAIFTAARDDRNSFGCGVEDKYTFWDSCLIEHLPTATTPRALAADLKECIRVKERGSGLRFSFPQASLGAKVADVRFLTPRAAPGNSKLAAMSPAEATP